MKPQLEQTIELPIEVKAQEAGSEPTPLTPAAGDSRSAAASRAYMDYCQRRANGELVDPDEFCRQFASAGRSQLVKLVHAHLFLEELEDEAPLQADGSIVDDSLFLPANQAGIRYPKLGTTVLGFRLLDELGHGSFARVYLAQETRIGNRLVAVKVSRGTSEADILGRIKHAHVVPIFSIQEDPGSGLNAVCMPYLGRATLDDVLDAVRLSKIPARADVILQTVEEASQTFFGDAKGTAGSRQAPRILRQGSYVDGIRFLGAQLADALAYIHDKGICHRDLKPSNVLLTPAGVPMLLDFNLSTDAAVPVVRLGGTVPYMAPEQLRAVVERRGDAKLDGRADVFSLGVILYELLTGRHPFGPVELKTPSEQLCRQLLDRHVDGPPRITDLNPQVDSGLADVIHRCLASDCAHRPQTAAELARLLHQGFAPVPRMRRWLAQHRIAMAAACAVVLAAVFVVAHVVAQLPSAQERRIAQAEEFCRDGQYQQAVQQYAAALEADPRNAAVWFARARAYQQLSKLDRAYLALAIQDYDEAQRLAPDGRNLAGIGYCYNLQAGKTVEALGCYEQAIQLGFCTAEVANNLGYTLVQLKRFAQAQKHLDDAIGMNSRLQPAFHNRGLLCLYNAGSRLKELEKANKRKDERTAQQCRSDIESLTKQGLDCFEIAQTLGQPSAHVDFEAACLCARGVHVDPKWLNPALEHLTAAVQRGWDPRPLQTDGALAILRSETRFQALLGRPAPDRPVPPPTMVLDPLQ